MLDDDRALGRGARDVLRDLAESSVRPTWSSRSRRSRSSCSGASSTRPRPARAARAPRGTGRACRSRASASSARGVALRRRAATTEALAAGSALSTCSAQLGVASRASSKRFVWAVEAALRAWRPDRAEELLAAVEQLPPGLRPPFLEAQAHRFRGLAMTRRRGARVQDRRRAFRDYDMPFGSPSRGSSTASGSSRGPRSRSRAAPRRGARDLRAARATPWLERVGSVERCGGRPRDLRRLRHREPGRREVLQGVRHVARASPARLAARRNAPDAVLRRVRRRARRAAAPTPASRRPPRRPPSAGSSRSCSPTSSASPRSSETRDAEEVRELLSRYFETLRGTLIGRYGGTVEKFIGDAVMAVWGTPVAHEDDAERAVRAALDLVAAVPRSGELDAGPARARGRAHGRGGRDARRRGRRAWWPATS